MSPTTKHTHDELKSKKKPCPQQTQRLTESNFPTPGVNQHEEIHKCCPMILPHIAKSPLPKRSSLPDRLCAQRHKSSALGRHVKNKQSKGLVRFISLLAMRRNLVREVHSCLGEVLKNGNQITNLVRLFRKALRYSRAHIGIINGIAYFATRNKRNWLLT